MDTRFVQMLPVVQRHYQKNGMKAGDKVVILCNTENYEPLIDAYYSAAVALQADVVLVKYLSRPPLSGLSNYLVDIAVNAEILVDLSFVTWAYTDSWARFNELQKKTGVRRIRGQTWGREEDVETLIKTPPDPQLVERTQRARELIDNATTIRVTSEIGTDFIVARGDPEKRISYCPSGQVAFAPPEDSANGLMVYIGGFRTQAPALQKRMVYQPVKIEFEEGKIVNISGDTEVGIMLDQWFRSHNDPNSYQFAHINLGLDHRVRLENLDNISVHFNYGGILMGFGANYDPFTFGNTTIKCKSHIDMALVRADYFVDDRKILEKGEFTEDSGLRLESH